MHPSRLTAFAKRIKRIESEEKLSALWTALTNAGLHAAADLFYRHWQNGTVPPLPLLMQSLPTSAMEDEFRARLRARPTDETVANATYGTTCAGRIMVAEGNRGD
jgi:hypothetical protein